MCKRGFIWVSNMLHRLLRVRLFPILESVLYNIERLFTLDSTSSSIFAWRYLYFLLSHDQGPRHTSDFDTQYSATLIISSYVQVLRANQGTILQNIKFLSLFFEEPTGLLMEILV